MILQCDNCGYRAEEEDLPAATDLTRRHSVGGMYSNRECPKCGALCFPADKFVVSMVKDLDLVVVKWAEDTGLVSMLLKSVLCYAYGKHVEFCYDRSVTPVVKITDAAIGDEATWDDVPGYLAGLPRDKFILPHAKHDSAAQDAVDGAGH